MDRFQALQVFLKVAHHQGFAAAARELNLSPPAVTRAIAALEQHMGTRLLVRTTRSVRLTESGSRFLPDAERILTALAEAEAAAVGSHAAPTGTLRVTAPVLFGRLFVTPLLGQFLDAYPALTAQTLFVDRVVNLMDEGLDVAIRIGPLPDSSVTAIRVGEVRRVMFAAPKYLKKAGTPNRLEDLDGHRIIHALTMGGSEEWPFRDRESPVSRRVSPRLQMNTNDAVIDLALSGWGLSRLLSYQVAGHVAAGKLKIVLADFEPAAIPIHVLHQEGRFVSAKVRAFVDFIVERLRSDPALN